VNKLKELGIWPQYPFPEFMKRTTIAMFGFFLIAVSNVMSFHADLGARPENSLYMGISNFTGITVGQASQLFTSLIIIVNLFLKIYPAIGTILDMYFVGLFMDLIMEAGWIPVPTTLVGRWIMLIFSVPIVAFGVALYLDMKIGAGPRDGMMVVLSERFGWKVSVVRNTMELIQVGLAILLKGPIGIGTVVLAVTPGFFMERGLKAFRYPFKKERLKALITNRLPEDDVD